MEITSINTETLSKMFLAGAKNLDAKKEWINELNVFPVPDGDTGTNMSMTIMSAARETVRAPAIMKTAYYPTTEALETARKTEREFPLKRASRASMWEAGRVESSSA